MALTGIQPPALGQCDDAGGAAPPRTGGSTHVFAGPYDPASTYLPGEMVTVGSTMYVATGNVPINTPPPSALWRTIPSLASLEARLAALESDTTAADVTALTARVVTLEGKVAALEALTTSQAALITAQDARITALEAPSPAPPPVVPDATWTKGDIVLWLENNGVDLSEKAKGEMDKDELLDLVANLLNP